MFLTVLIWVDPVNCSFEKTAILMNKNIAIISDYISKHSDNHPENLTLETRLDEVGIDSLAMLELFFEFEDKYSFRLPQDIKVPETIGDLVAIVERYQPVTINV